jgi:hypothetical protein
MSNVLDMSGGAGKPSQPQVSVALRGSARAAREPGQSLVELAIVLPAVVIGLLLVIGLGVLGQAKAGVQAVASEAARAGALTSSPAAAETAGTHRAYQVATGYGLDPGRLAVTIDIGDFQRGGTVSAEVEYRVPLHELLPLIWGADVALSQAASEPIDIYRTGLPLTGNSR